MKNSLIVNLSATGFNNGKWPTQCHITTYPHADSSSVRPWPVKYCNENTHTNLLVAKNYISLKISVVIIFPCAYLRGNLISLMAQLWNTWFIQNWCGKIVNEPLIMHHSKLGTMKIIISNKTQIRWEWSYFKPRQNTFDSLWCNTSN